MDNDTRPQPSVTVELSPAMYDLFVTASFALAEALPSQAKNADSMYELLHAARLDAYRKEANNNE